MEKVKHILVFVLSFVIMATSCRKQQQIVTEQTKEFSVINFKQVKAGGNMDISITKGANFSVRAIGNPLDIQKLVVTQLNGEISLAYVNLQNTSKIKLQITMPSLEGFEFYNKCFFSVSGFNESSIVRGFVNDESTGSLQLTSPTLKLDLQNNSAITVNGDIDNLDLMGNNNVTINTYGVSAKFVRAIIMKQSTARVFVSNTLNASAIERSKIFYKGNPLSQFTSELDNSTIMPE